MATPATVKSKRKSRASQGHAEPAATGTPKGRGRSSQARADRLTALGLAFRRVSRALNRMRGRDTHLGGEQLSHAQFQLLLELFERGELPAGELAVAAGLTPATVTQMLDHLAERGHVERARSEIDRRVVVSRLTPEGALRIQARREDWQRRWEESLAELPTEDLQAATRVLERLGSMFEEASNGEACGEAQNPSHSGG